MADAETLKKIQESLEALMKQNATLTEEVQQLKKDNVELRKQSSEKSARVEENKNKWEHHKEEAVQTMKLLSQLKSELLDDDVKEDFFKNDSGLTELYKGLMELSCGERFDQEHSDKEAQKEIMLAKAEYNEPFNNYAKEEHLDCYFGEDNNFSALAMRRFAERYETVKTMNSSLRIVGWDDPAYRAGKIKLCLKGEAFDHVQFASSMHEKWTNDDSLLLENLKDMFINIQAIEMNILHFEQSVQEPKEGLGEYMGRLKRLVKEAYDGDAYQETDRKVAWKFVSGLSDCKIREKLLETGWMETRQKSKALDELLKTAEIARRKEEVAKAMTRGNQVAVMIDDSERDTQSLVAAFNRSRRSDTPSSESKSSSRASSMSRGSAGSAGIPTKQDEQYECYYCKRKHKGGWFTCEKRKAEDPTWRPTRRKNSSRGSKDFQ